MKKLIPLLLCILLLAGCAQTYDGPTEAVSVLQEAMNEYYSYDGTVSVTERTTYAYDIYGNLAQTMEYTNGTAVRKTVYTYDDRGNLVRVEGYGLGGWFPRRTNQTEYTYDDHNRLTAKIDDYSGEITEHHYTYDDEANTRTTTYLDLVTVEQFDGNGNVIREESAEADGQTYTYLYEYDGHGQCVAKYLQEGGTRTEEYRYEYEYDDQGRILRLIELTGGVRKEHSRREYNDAERSMTFYSRGSISHTVFYDEEGREIERILYFDDTDDVGLRTTYTYGEIQTSVKGADGS